MGVNLRPFAVTDGRLRRAPRRRARAGTGRRHPLRAGSALRGSMRSGRVRRERTPRVCEAVAQNQLRAAFGLAGPLRARFHRGINRRAAEVGACRQRLGNGFLFCVVRRRGLVGVAAENGTVASDNNRADAIGRCAGRAFAALCRPPCADSGGRFRRCRASAAIGSLPCRRSVRACGNVAGGAKAKCALPSSPSRNARIDGQTQGVGPCPRRGTCGARGRRPRRKSRRMPRFSNSVTMARADEGVSAGMTSATPFKWGRPREENT